MTRWIIAASLLLALPAPAGAQAVGCPPSAAMFDGYESAGCSVRHVGRCTVRHDRVVGIRTTLCQPVLPRYRPVHHHRRAVHRPERGGIIERESYRYERVIRRRIP